MSLSHTELFRFSAGNKRAALFETTFDSSYPTGGEAVVAADFGLSYLEGMVVLNASATGRLPSWDRANSKILVRDNVHTHVSDLAASYTQNQATAAATAQWAEVADTTNLSAFKCHVLVFGV